MSEPMVPVAPARFSITNVWPSASVRRWAMTRATTSLEPPGGHATTMRTGLTGYACATTTEDSTRPATATRSATTGISFILSSFYETPSPWVRRFLSFAVFNRSSRSRRAASRRPGLEIRPGHVARVHVAGLLDAPRSDVDPDDFERLGLAQVVHEMLDALGDVVHVAAPNFGAVSARARESVAPHDVVELFAVLVPVLLVHGARHELRPEQGGGAAGVAADRHAEIGDAPTFLFVHAGRLHVVYVDHRALAELPHTRLLDIGVAHITTEVITGILDVLRADVEPDDQPFLVLRFVVEEMLGPPRHQAAVPWAHPGAFVALPDGPVALEINRDLVATAVEMLGVGRARPEDGMEERRGAAVLPGNRQPELGDRPALPLLHVLRLHVVDVHEGVAQRHVGQSSFAPESLITRSYLS